MTTLQSRPKTLAELDRCIELPRLSVEEQSRQAKADRVDRSIAEKVDSALWKNGVLRSTDYGNIDVTVKDGVVYLSGHVISASNQRRAEDAVRSIASVLEVKSYLVPDDDLIRKVADALGKIEHIYGVKFFTGAQNGVVALHGEILSPEVRSLAIKCAATIPGVRGVINHMRPIELNQKKEDLRFLQPAIGEQMYFRDGIPGTIQKVIINPDSLRVIGMIVQWGNTNSQADPTFLTYREDQAHQRSVSIPMDAVRYLTKSSGFLHIDSAEAARSGDFDPSGFTEPGEDWTPPYPYCPDDVLFPQAPVEDL